MPIVGQFGSLAGLGSLILPGGAMESIATVTVGSGGASSIQFTSIPGTYQHLQIRYIGKSSTSASGYGYAKIQLNSTDQSAIHELAGDGSTPYAAGYTIYPWVGLWLSDNYYMTQGYAGGILEILDYTSTSKTKVIRNFAGYNANTASVHGGYISMRSHLFSSVTSAVSSITLIGVNTTGAAANLAEHSTFALYGIKAP